MLDGTRKYVGTFSEGKYGDGKLDKPAADNTALTDTAATTLSNAGMDERKGLPMDDLTVTASYTTTTSVSIRDSAGGFSLYASTRIAQQTTVDEVTNFCLNKNGSE